jgi:Acetyltransferases, including N-acetylases of ribosomal proteins
MREYLMMIELVKWKKEYVEPFCLQSNSDDLYRNMSDSFPKTADECRRTVAFFTNSSEEKEYARAILLDGKMIGSIAVFFESDIYRKNAEIAYWIGKEYWGRGIMTRVLKQFTQSVFSQYDIERIYARPFAYNKGSQRALEKAGFVPEGILKYSVCKDGQTFDACMYAITKS